MLNQMQCALIFQNATNPKKADQNQVESDDKVEHIGKNQDQNAGDKRD